MAAPTVGRLPGGHGLGFRFEVDALPDLPRTRDAGPRPLPCCDTDRLLAGGDTEPRRHSAVRTRPSPAWSPRQTEPGADTPPATTEQRAVPFIWAEFLDRRLR